MASKSSRSTRPSPTPATARPDLHVVRPKARVEESATILPPDLWRRYEAASIWRDPAFNTRGVRIA
jgi:hypothetical protein